MSGRLEGRVAIVTGGSRGIGAAIAGAFAREGARVVIVARKADGLAAQVETLERAVGSGRVFARPCHVGDADAVRDLVAWTAGEVGLPTVLVNNAGTNPHFGPLLEVESGAWNKTFEVNLKGPFVATREVAARLIGAGQAGAVINVASVVGLRAAPYQGVYAMTKAAMVSMTRTLAVELSGARIRVNAIAPGLVDTRLAAAIVGNEALVRTFTDHTALGRVAQPEEIAGMAVYLASDEASYVTGQTFCVDGGYTVM